MKHGREDFDPNKSEELYVGTIFPRHRLDLAGPRFISSLINKVSAAVDAAGEAGMLEAEVYHSYNIGEDRLSIASTRLSRPYVDNPDNYVAITVNRRWDSSYDKLAGRLLVSEYVIDTRPESGAIANSVDLIDFGDDHKRITYPTNLGVIGRDTTRRMRVFRGEEARLEIPTSPYVSQYTLEDVSCAWNTALYLHETIATLSAGTEDERHPFDSTK